MKKKIKIEVDCANCAAKMEAAAKEIAGVNSCSVSFMTQKMAIDIADDQFDQVMQEVIKVCKKIEPDCEFYL